MAAPTMDDDTLIVYFAGSGSAQVKGDTTGKLIFQGVLTPHTFSLIPRQQLFHGRWQVAMSAGFFHIARARLVEFAASSTPIDPDRVELRPLMAHHDPYLVHLALALRAEFTSPAPRGALYTDALAHTIMLHLLHIYSNAPSVRVRAPGALSLIQKYDLTEYIQVHLDRTITIADLARLVGLSVPHFERLFSATFHMPPYRYVLNERVERAKMLLCDARKSLFEVARESGFADQSHFARHFKTTVGITPRQYAHAVRG
ncbi:MAG: AraC family transcriptional regulator [Chloroflexota bacterium]|nr:AraC family transcriptional regulator [Chloroflexota bacterium]